MEHQEKIEDIKKNPKKHRHTLNGLVACSTVDGTLVTRIMVAHQLYARLGTNGGIRCDVVEGACACGGWH